MLASVCLLLFDRVRLLVLSAILCVYRIVFCLFVGCLGLGVFCVFSLCVVCCSV